MKKLLIIVLISLLILTACGKTTIKEAKNEYYRYNHKKAEEMFKKLSKQGNLEAKYYLGQLYYEGLKTEKKPEKAKKLFKEVLNNYNKNTKNPFLLDGIVYYYKEVKITAENIEKAEKIEKKVMNILKKSKEKLKKNPNYQYLLAIYYDSGKGLKKSNDKKALKWYKKASKNGNLYANEKIGYLYREGSSGGKILKDQNKAIKYYLESAKRGDYYSQAGLYFCYLYKSEVENKKKNLKKAKKWVKKLRENKYAPKNFKQIAKKYWNEYNLWNY